MLQKKQIATDREQSKRLLACGVKPETADMEWQPTGLKDDYRLNVGLFLADAVPAWSLSALLALLPREINDKGIQTILSINANADSGVWSIDYYDYYMDGRILYQEASDPIETCVRAIEWLTASGYSLNNIEQ